ncbi:MAG: ATP-binding protein [Methanobacterium sp.]
MSISDMIKEGESTTVEFKESMNDAAYKTISAFANTEGGTLLCGVSDEGAIKGTDCSDETVRDIIGRIVSTMRISPSVNPVEIDREKILEIKVEKSSFPISYRGKYYKRIGNTTREMQGEELITFFQHYSTWDTLTNDYSLEEIDEDTVNRFIKIGIANGRLNHISETENLIDKLKHLGVFRDGKLTNAAIMLFGKNPQEHFINASIRVARLKDDITIIGDKLIEGNLFQQIEEAEKEIKNNIQVRYDINQDSFARKNIWDYPIIAIREALMNAIVHRDYFRNNVPTQVKIFDDHIHIYNIGELPEGMTIEQLNEAHPSVPRNPLIVRILHRAGFIEELGSGIKRMTESLEEEGLPKPEFKEEASGFSTFMWQRLSEESLKEKGLNDRQIMAVIYVYEKGTITLSDYSKIAPEVNDRTLRRDLDALVKNKLLKAIGEKKGRRYELAR